MCNKQREEIDRRRQNVHLDADHTTRRQIQIPAVEFWFAHHWIGCTEANCCVSERVTVVSGKSCC